MKMAVLWVYPSISDKGGLFELFQQRCGLQPPHHVCQLPSGLRRRRLQQLLRAVDAQRTAAAANEAAQQRGIGAHLVIDFLRREKGSWWNVDVYSNWLGNLWMW